MSFIEQNLLISNKKMEHSKKEILAIFIDSDTYTLSDKSMQEEIAALNEYFSEIHVCVFAKGRMFSGTDVQTIGNHAWLYYIPNTLFLRFILGISFVSKHLVWRGSFRPTKILSYGVSYATYFASITGQRYSTPHFIKLGFNTVFSSYNFSFINYKIRRTLKRAHSVILEGGELYKKIRRIIGKEENKIIQLSPYIDFEKISSSLDTINFTSKYNRDFFFISHLPNFESNTVSFICKLTKKIVERYIKAGYIIYVPKENVRQSKRIVRSSGMSAYVFIEEEVENMLPVYKSARIYISPMKQDELNMPVVYALGLSMPVITTHAGYAEQLFKDSFFSKYLCEYGNVDAFFKNIISLIDNAYEWNSFKVNASSLLSIFPHDTKKNHVEKFVYIFFEN